MSNLSSPLLYSVTDTHGLFKTAFKVGLIKTVNIELFVIDDESNDNSDDFIQ